MTLYLIVACCPHCDEVVNHVEETECPVGLMQEVPITARYCPMCGFEIVGAPADEWDVCEDAEIERVTPTQERDRS